MKSHFTVEEVVTRKKTANRYELNIAQLQSSDSKFSIPDYCRGCEGWKIEERSAYTSTVSCFAMAQGVSRWPLAGEPPELIHVGFVVGIAL